MAILEEHVRHRGTVDSVTEMIHQGGFEVVDIETDTFRMRFADGSSLLRHYFIRLGFVPGWKSVVAPENLQVTFETLERNLNRVAAEQGELSLTVPLACIEARKNATRQP